MSTLTASSPQEALTSERYPMLLFFDGECAFCNRWVNKVRLADKAHRIRFGTKQGPTYQQKVVPGHPDLKQVDSVVLVSRRPDGSEEYLIRSAAVARIIKGLPEFRLFDLVLQICPTFLADIGYRIFSKLRTSLFGKWSHCRVPLEEDKQLYVD